MKICIRPIKPPENQFIQPSKKFPHYCIHKIFPHTPHPTISSHRPQPDPPSDPPRQSHVSVRPVSHVTRVNFNDFPAHPIWGALCVPRDPIRLRVAIKGRLFGAMKVIFAILIAIADDFCIYIYFLWFKCDL